MLTTPDHLRGRARSGHSLAANAANSVGQIYVATMAGWIGCGPTMILGGALTLVLTGVAVWRIPALVTFRDDKYKAVASDETSGSDHEEGCEEGSPIPAVLGVANTEGHEPEEHTPAASWVEFSHTQQTSLKNAKSQE